MGVAANSRSSFTMSARKGVDDFERAASLPSNENVPRGLDDMSSEFTGTNRSTTSANTAAAAAMLTAAKAANCTRSPCTMPAVAHAAGGKMAASCPVSWAPSALNAARSSDWPDSANEPNTAASVAASVSTMTATFACLKREDTAAISTASTTAAARGRSGASTMDSAMHATPTADTPAADAYTAKAGTITSTPNSRLMAYSDAMRDSTTDDVGTGSDITRS